MVRLLHLRKCGGPGPAPQFFTPAEASLGSIIAFATVGISFLSRPLGAIVMGRVGDKYSSRAVLIVILVLMGVGTSLVGLLSTYASIGIGLRFS